MLVIVKSRPNKLLRAIRDNQKKLAHFEKQENLCGLFKYGLAFMGQLGNSIDPISPRSMIPIVLT